MIPASPAIAHCWLERIGLLQWFYMTTLLELCKQLISTKSVLTKSVHSASIMATTQQEAPAHAKQCTIRIGSHFLILFLQKRQQFQWSYYDALMRRLSLGRWVTSKEQIYTTMFIATPLRGSYLQRKLHVIKLAQTYLIYFLCQKIYFIPVYRSVNTLMEHHSLDRRRLKHAHFQYALLRVFSWYNFDLPKYPLHEATHETLLQVTGTYYGAFMKKYSGKLPFLYLWRQKNTLPVCLYLLLSVVFWCGIFGVKYFLHFQLHIMFCYWTA